PEGPPAWAAPDDETPAPPRAEPTEPPSASSAREAIRQTRAAGDATDSSGSEMAEADAGASPDDLDAETELIGVDDLLARELGAQVIDEIPRT
ncbi:MAG: DNA polymerase III subunit gamma/tau, partial [Nocardioides sp.]